ncbi:hypothetical protein RBS60_11570 [Sinomonas sp. ASV486]|uniref:hypothetical protein n=1 Tax=Sinomonas sp. ASV486 TaxID=3051170 RepID=UPI0027DDA77C|nr:hypothetical protein [Sinomonas sp. ASV486]MDQ4490834.1 hypothetical protein [Sinomonas sp. ASV486]
MDSDKVTYALPTRRRYPSLADAFWFCLDVLPVLVIACVILLSYLIDGTKLGSVDLASLAGTVVMSGLLSCAVLETAKRLLRIRGLYQQRQARLWFAAQTRNQVENEMIRGNPDDLYFDPSGKTAIMELLSVAGVVGYQQISKYYTRGRSFGTVLEGLIVFDLPIEQLTAQVAQAADAALEHPQGYPALTVALFGSPRSLEADSENIDLSAAVSIRRSLDLFQISIGQRWRRYISASPLALSGLFALAMTSLGPRNSNGFFLTTVAAVFIGGYLSWLTRDLSAGIERWRR